MDFFINNTNNKPCLLAVHRTPVRLPLAVSIRNLLDFHWFGCGFAVSPLEVHRKSPLDFVVWPKMPRQALENHQKNTVVKKQKKMDSAYPQSDRVHSETQWECKDLPFAHQLLRTLPWPIFHDLRLVWILTYSSKMLQKTVCIYLKKAQSAPHAWNICLFN